MMMNMTIIAMMMMIIVMMMNPMMIDDYHDNDNVNRFIVNGEPELCGNASGARCLFIASHYSNNNGGAPKNRIF